MERSSAPPARRVEWIAASAFGWAAGLPWLFLVSVVPAADPLVPKVVLTLAAVVLGGLCVGAVTGAVISKLSPMRVEGGVMLLPRSHADGRRPLHGDAVRAGLRRDDARRQLGFLPVVDADKQVIGVITDRDLAIRVLADDLPGDTPVGQVMTQDVRICRPDDELQAAEWKMSTTRKSRLVVADDEGRCLGVLSLSDVAQADSRSRAGGVLRAVTRREAPAHVVLS